MNSEPQEIIPTENNITHIENNEHQGIPFFVLKV